MTGIRTFYSFDKGCGVFSFGGILICEGKGYLSHILKHVDNPANTLEVGGRNVVLSY
jgi:hypothetical protein